MTARAARSGFAGAFALLALAASSSVAQERLISGARTVIAPSYTAWSFSDALLQDSVVVERVWQLALPVSTSFTAGAWTFDIGAALTTARLQLPGGRSVSLDGPTDIRIRAVGRVIGDRLLVTAGLNAPTGKTRLDASELDVLRVLSAPGLGMPTAQLGLGLGGTAGLVYAWQAGDWGLAIGGSFEARGRYSPVEARIAGLSAETDLDPGHAVRFSLGADRLIGSGRFSVLVATDLYSEDHLTVTGASQAATAATYRLGPQVSVNAFLDLGVRGFQRFTLAVADRYRSKFTAADGSKAAGSSGNLLDLSVEAMTGGGGATRGVFGQASARFDSGLGIDNTITTAAATTGTLRFGLWQQAGRAVVQPFASLAVGRIDAGPLETSAFGWGAGLMATVR